MDLDPPEAEPLHLPVTQVTHGGNEVSDTVPIKNDQGDAEGEAEEDEDEEVLYYVDDEGNRIAPDDIAGYTVELAEGEEGNGNGNDGAEPSGKVERDEALEVNGQNEQENRQDEQRLEDQQQAEILAHANAHAIRYRRPFKPKMRPLSDQLQKSRQEGTISSSKASNPPNYTVTYHFTGHRKAVSSVKFSPDGKWLATAGSDGRILLFSIYPPNSPPVFIRCFSIPPLSKPTPSKSQSTSKAKDGPIGGGGINEITFSPDSTNLAGASDDKLIRVWTLDLSQRNQDGQSDVKDLVPRLRKLNGFDEPAASLAVEEESANTRILRGHTSFVYCIAYSPQGNLLASGSYDETIRIWDVKRRKCLRSLPAHADPVTAVHFSRDGTMLCSCGHDGLLRLWDASTGQCLKTLVGEANPPASFATFTPNSRYILCSSLDSTIRLWDYHAAQCVKVYSGHKNIKYHSPAFFHIPRQDAESPYVVAGSEDGKIIFWDLQSRKIMIQLEGHEGPLIGLAFEPKSGMLASASLDSDHSVKLWTDNNRVATIDTSVSAVSLPQVKEEITEPIEFSGGAVKDALGDLSML